MNEIELIQCYLNNFYGCDCEHIQSQIIEILRHDYKVKHQYCGFSPEPRLTEYEVDKLLRERQDELHRKCYAEMSRQIDQIGHIVKRNPRSSKNIIDILCLVFPAVAQQFEGIPGLVIVGIITILCKDRLGLS